MIALGKSNAEITGALVLNPKTVSNQGSTLFSKMQVVNRAQFDLRAEQASWGEESRTLPPAHTEETSFTVLGFARGLED